MELQAIKEMLKAKTYAELLQIEIDCTRKSKKPYTFGLEVAKFHRRLQRQVVKEQTSRKLEAWTRVEV